MSDKEKGEHMETQDRERLQTSALARHEQVLDRNAALSSADEGKSILIAAGPKQEAKRNRRCVP